MKFEISISSKKINSKPVHNKKYPKVENKSTQKEAFNVILIDSVYRADENYYPKFYLEKCNSNDSLNVESDEEYFDDFDDSYEKITMKKVPSEKTQMKKIKSINLFLEETIDLTSIYTKMYEIFVSQPFQENFFTKNIRAF